MSWTCDEDGRKVTLRRKSFVLNQEGVETRRSRRKLRRCDEIQEDVGRDGCRTWRINTQSRKDGRKLTGEVKSHPGMWYQWQKNTTVLKYTLQVFCTQCSDVTLNSVYPYRS
jgi:hypothetical protein